MPSGPGGGVQEVQQVHSRSLSLPCLLSGCFSFGAKPESEGLPSKPDVSQESSKGLELDVEQPGGPAAVYGSSEANLLALELSLTRAEVGEVETHHDLRRNTPSSPSSERRTRLISEELMGIRRAWETLWGAMSHLSCLVTADQSQRVEQQDEEEQAPKSSPSVSLGSEERGAFRDRSYARNMMILSANPLVLHDCSFTAPHSNLEQAIAVSSLEAHYERDSVEQMADSTGVSSSICLSFKPLTVSTLGENLTLNIPDILHVSSHGTMLSDGAYALALEDEAGCARLFQMAQLQRMLRVSSHRCRLIFLSACHSEIAGNLFVDAGFPHVVVCKASERVLDIGCRYFMKFFYASLFQGCTVQQAFDTACVNVDAYIPRQNGAQGQQTESEKFLLLPRDADHSNPLFPPPEARLEEQGRGQHRRVTSIAPVTPRKTPPKCVPPRTEHCVGRQPEIQQSIGLLRRHRCVSIFGARRYGKSSVAKSVCHYVHERNSFRDGLFWLDLSEHRSRASVALELCRMFAVHTGDDQWRDCFGEYKESPATPTYSLPVSSISDEDDEQEHHGASYSSEPHPRLLANVLKRISNWHCLIIVDSAGALGTAVVAEVLRSTHLPRVLVTSVTCVELPVSDGFAVGMVWIRELPLSACLDLVYRLAPWMLQADQYKDTVEMIQHCRQSPYTIRCRLQELLHNSRPV